MKILCSVCSLINLQYFFSSTSTILNWICLKFKVPNSMNGRFKIENHEFNEEYKDHSSPIYQTIAREIEEGIMESLNEYENIHVKVLNLT